MKSSQNTLWVAGAGVLAVLLVVATYFLVVAPKRAEAADLAEQRVSTQQTNAAIEQRTALLASQFQTLDEKRRELAAITATLPAQAEVPDLLRQVEAYAGSAGVRVTQVTPGAPTVFDPAGASTSAAAPAVPATGPEIVQIPLTLGVSGTFPQIELYVKNLQVDLTRHLLLQGITLNTDQAGGSSADGVTATLTGSIFVLRDTSAAAGSATSTGSTTSTATTTTTTTTATVS